MTLWTYLLLGGGIWLGLALLVWALLYASGESYERDDGTRQDSARRQ